MKQSIDCGQSMNQPHMGMQASATVVGAAAAIMVPLIDTAKEDPQAQQRLDLLAFSVWLEDAITVLVYVKAF